jgi:hypothetical protein
MKGENEQKHIEASTHFAFRGAAWLHSVHDETRVTGSNCSENWECC